MTKRIFIMFLLLALAFGLYAMTATAKGEGVPGPTRTAQAVPTATEAAKTCEVITGVDRGTVNLRSCAGTACNVLDIVTEGERLSILTAGLWTHVTNADGVTGYINSNYCKGK